MTGAMSEKSFDDRMSEMIKNKLSPTLAADDECDQMWSEILIQVSNVDIISYRYLGVTHESD